MPDFYQYFKENMEGLGLPAPSDLFPNLQTAVGTAAALTGLIEKFGRKVTVREVAGAGTKFEKLSVLGVCLLTYYAGAVIGSIAVATGRTLAGGTSLSDVIAAANFHGLTQGWLYEDLQMYPGIYDTTNPSRGMYRYVATAA